MFNQFHEEELILSLDVPKEQLKDSKLALKEEFILSRVRDIYKNKMLAYMKSVPHITPTEFELKLRHQKIKQNLLKQLKTINKSIENCAVNRLADKCEAQLEIVFKRLSEKNQLEYKKCQLGFTLGWKCNVNQSQPNYGKTIDDRF